MRQSRRASSCASISKRYGDVQAVRSLDLEIGRGEFFTLLGPSGCGKTTTLRVIAGFEEPNSGTRPDRRRRHGGDPALPAAHEHRLPELRALPAPERRGQRRVRPEAQAGPEGRDAARAWGRSSSASGLAAEAKRKPRQLSGGQQQRVALARALVNRPSVLLLDEPLGALDLKLRKRLQVELKDIQRDVGITFVYVTHDQEEALTMSDRIAVMNDGVVEQIAEPRGGLRPSGDDLRRRLHRRVEPDAGASEEGRRPGRGGARRRRQRPRFGERVPRRRALPRGGPPREASDPLRRGPRRRRAAKRGRDRRELALSGDRDPDRRAAPGRRGDDGAGGEHRRGRAPASARRRGQGAVVLDVPTTCTWCASQADRRDRTN